MLGCLRSKNMVLSKKEAALEETNEHLQTALSQVREMGGIHSFCSVCKSILDDDGSWIKIDTYLKEKTKAEFSHGMCPDCAKEYEIPTDPESERVETGNPASSPD